MIKMEILMLYFYCHNRKMEKNKIQNKNLKKIEGSWYWD